MMAGPARTRSPRTLAVALAAFVVLVTGAMWVLAISPKHTAASTLDTQIRSTQAELKLAQRRTRTTSTQKQPAESAPLLRALPDTVAMPDIMLELSRLASEASISLDTVTPQAPISFDGYSAVPITVVVSGKFFAVKQFLHDLRTQVRVDADGARASGRLFDVESVQLGQAVPVPLLTATLAVRAFVFTGRPASTAPASSASIAVRSAATEGAAR